MAVHVYELGWADEGKIGRIEKEHKPRSSEIFIFDSLHLLTYGVISLQREVRKFLVYLKHIFHYNEEMARRKSRFRSRLRFIFYIAILGVFAWLGFKYYDPVKVYLLQDKALQVAAPEEKASPEVSSEKLTEKLSALVKALPRDLEIQSTAAPEITERLDLNGDGIEEIVADLNDSGAYATSYGVFEFAEGKWKFLDLVSADGSMHPAVFWDGASVRNAEVFKVLEDHKALAQVSGLEDGEGNWSWEAQAFSWNGSKYVYDSALSQKILKEQPKRFENGEPVFE